MGMAASQARYLALVARKSNCEYEGQQINQARLNLSNQSANLFNQMLGLSVPVPPSVQDFTTTQYSFTDGYNESVIDKWEQLANPDADGYNYVVEYHYEANVYKGFEKKMNDPQIQFAYTIPTDVDLAAERAQVREIYDAQKAISQASDAYDTAKTKYEGWKAKAAQLGTYRDAETYRNKAQITDHTTSGYTVFEAADRSGAHHQFLSYDLIGENATVGKASLWADSNGDVYSTYDLALASGNVPVTAITPGTKLYCNSADTSGKLTTNSTYNGGGVIPNFELTAGYNNWYITGAEGNFTIVQNNPGSPLVYGTAQDKADLEQYLETWEANGVSLDPSDVYYDLATGFIAFKSDLDSLNGVDTSALMKTLYIYHPTGAHTQDDTYQSIESANATLAALKNEAENAYADLKLAEEDFKLLNVPQYVGNTQLTSLGELTDEQMAEIKQIITDMTVNGANCNFLKCFSSSLNIDADDYIGGIYSFERDGVKYYTTYFDLAETANATTFTNDIDNQPKLDYYYATYIRDNISTVSKAVLDTDSKGRFKTIRFEDSAITYNLNFEQVTDEEAYNDAMNKYYYENARYDKMVQDINAKTSLIHQQDQELELRLKQLDTEQNALSNEIDAVSKVVKDNVESSFKTFGG